MKTLLTLLALVLPALQSEVHGYGPSGPEMCFAIVDGKGQVTIRSFTASRPFAEEGTVKIKDGDVKFKVERQSIEEFILTLPLKVVKGYDTAGKPIDSKKLAELLAKESPVVVVQGEPRVAQLRPFKKDITVLSIAVPLRPMYYGYGPPGVVTPAPASSPRPIDAPPPG